MCEPLALFMKRESAAPDGMNFDPLRSNSLDRLIVRILIIILTGSHSHEWIIPSMSFNISMILFATSKEKEPKAFLRINALLIFDVIYIKSANSRRPLESSPTPSTNI
jgi:hypothetical protein